MYVDVDERIQSHVFHVVIDSEEMSAEIYTHDKQLHKSYSLSEGRQRCQNSDDGFNFDASLSDADSQGVPPQIEPTEKESAMMERMKDMEERVKTMEEREKMMEEREKQMEKEMEEQEKEIEDLRLQAGQEREGISLQTAWKKEGKESRQVQDRMEENERGKKRKR